MIKLYGFPQTRSVRVAWALEEANAEYEYGLVNLRTGEHKQPAFLAINPFGKIPSLVDDGLVISESAAICTHIAEKFPAAKLIPTDAKSRAAYFQWLFFVVSELEVHLWTAAKHDRFLPEDKRIPDIANTSYWEFEKAAAILSTHLKAQPYLAGDQFSAADIICVSVLHWAHHVKVTLDDTLLSYMNRVSERPALTRARKREADAT
ncbi:glutathione S-transferase family protein [Candidatus Methylopumilus turicensis]|uniref:Putative glutathione S-transferase protein n=1 Tax=Candidatus Methylopumilus turicensis TaxID=1581680 RepID=A0A0B7IZ81_9PROT|nr:glutathione S-transferase family protein [Candidatus Methylopumilus turicensis]CEN55707.1 putative glutathione S-transferase protein [Candidatus Methylopumilus turicensis]